MRAAGESVEIGGADAHKILHVLRLRQGDRIETIDSAGCRFESSLSIDRDRVRATLERAIAKEHAASMSVDLAQAIPKGQKMDFVVEKATELGAGAILPFYSERTVVSDVGHEKTERWRRLAKSAAQQCGRSFVPQIAAPVSFDGLLEAFDRYDAVLFPWELAAREPLREILPALLRPGGRLLVVIGPEGGFSHAEAEAASARGARLIWLGERILRSETAGMAMLAIFSLFCG